MSSDNNTIKTEDPTYVKDTENQALLSVDVSTRNEYLLRRKALERSQSAESDINSMKQEIDQLKYDIGDIKGMLAQVINKIT